MSGGFKLKYWAAALLVGVAAVPTMGSGQANAGAADIARETAQSVIQTVLQNVRDQIRRRRLAVPGGLSRFAPDNASANASIYDDAFGALALAADMPVKAPPLVAVAAPQWLYTAFGSASADWDRAAGITTHSFTLAGGGSVTRIGVWTSDDALTFMVTGTSTHSRAPNVRSHTPTITGTVAYQRGAFSTDSSVTGQWTDSDVTTGAIVTSSDSHGLTFANNYQYRYGDTTFFEPTVGYSHSSTTGGGIRTTIWEVQGGARVGTEWAAANGIRVQPSVTVVAYSPVDVTVSGLPAGVAGLAINTPAGAANANTALEGHVGVRASGKINYVLSSSTSMYIEGTGRAIRNTSGAGVRGGFTLTLN